MVGTDATILMTQAALNDAILLLPELGISNDLGAFYLTIDDHNRLNIGLFFDITALPFLVVQDQTAHFFCISH